MNDFLNRLKKEKEEAANVPKWDPQAVITDWKDRLGELLTNMRFWLAPAVDDGSATIQSKHYTLTEELLGTYQAEGMVVEFTGKRKVEVEPIATMIMGAKGKVELHFVGCKSKGTVVLLNGGDRWVIWPDDRHLRTNPKAIPTLNEKAFFELLNVMV